MLIQGEILMKISRLLMVILQIAIVVLGCNALPPTNETPLTDVSMLKVEKARNKQALLVWTCSQDADISAIEIRNLRTGHEENIDASNREYWVSVPRNEVFYIFSVRVIDSSANVSRGKMVRVATFGYQVKSTRFDAMGDVQSTSISEYYSNGSVKKSTSRYGDQYTVDEYDNQGKQIKSSSFDGSDTLYSYSVFEYNTNGDSEKSSSYDVSGSLVYYRTLNHNVIANIKEYTHHGADGRIKSKTIDVFDADGNWIKSSDYEADGTLSHEYILMYDESGYLIKESVENQSNDNWHTIYEYDENGNNIKYSFIHDTYEAESSYSTREYSALGNLIKGHRFNLKDELLGYFINEYDNDGNCIKATSFDSEGNITGYRLEEYIDINVAE
jgi:hypothetical protein